MNNACSVLVCLAVKFVGTVSAVAVSIACELRLDAITIDASQQIPETRRVASDAAGLVRAVLAVRVSVAHVTCPDASSAFALKITQAARCS